MNSLQLLAESASTFADEWNWLFWILVSICGFVATAIAAVLIYWAIRYHRKRDNELPAQIQGNIKVEAAWTFIPLVIFLGMFGWGSKLYFRIERPPDNARNIYAIGKQWMWKLQYATGQREINTLHVPVGEPVKLTMTSQDVIHSFFVPAFRIKQDVLPGRYTTIWFQATKPGRYHLFCAEYCGTKHSGMIGWVYAMEPHDFQAWLEQGGAEGSLASTGEKLFHQFGCANCHHFDGQGRCPVLQDLYGRQVRIAGGTTVIADETYIRESILNPRAKIVEGFQPIMPTFDGQLREEQVIALIAYIRAMGPQPGTQQPSSPGTAPTNYGGQKGISGPDATSISGSKPGAR
ncbi:MAG: cytochrome c oxidase subunit II [Bryobacteraceae bacterium]